MEQRLRQVFAEVFKLDPSRVTDTLSPEDVKGWDSLGHLALVNALEAMFSVTFEDGDLTEMENVGRIKEVLRLRGVAE
jgi:acyl carrier protein